MKKTALLAAAAALFVATPAMAAGGHVGASYGNTETDTTDFDTWQVEGAFGGAASGSVGYQIDGGIGQSDSAGDVDHYTLAGHLYWNADNWRLGAVVATLNADDGSLSADDTVYGVEGTFNLAPNAVVTGSYTVGETEFLTDLDTWNADIGLNYYFTDNFRVTGTAGTGNLEATGGDFDTSTFGLSGEWQPATMPVSFTLGYNTFDTDVFGEYNSFTIGARWNFGGSTLRERDNQTPFETRTALYQRVYNIQ